MTRIRKLALVLCLASLFTNYSNSQNLTAASTTELVPGTVYTTGNIVQPTTTTTGSSWTGAVYQDQLTCWAYGDPGYCGPNAIVRPGNAINFSYGSTYVYQQQHINTIVPSGSGLQVNGYTFGFNAKNGNGWDNGMTDQLTALVRFWDNTGNKGAGNLLYGTSWNLSYNTQGWQTFSYNETFTTPLAVTDMGLVQYGFIGRDNNGWAGPYGPEIYNISFNVKYSVDPCASNPLYSPTCKGYLDALAKLLPDATSTTVATTDGTQTTTIDTATGLQPSDPTQPAPPPPGSAPPPGTEPPPGSPPPPPPPAGSQPASNSNPAAAPANQPPPAGGSSSQPKIGEVKTAGDNKSTSAPALSTVLSMIGSNQARIGNEAKAVVQAAESQATQAATAAQQQAETVASTAVVQSASTSATGGAVASGTTARTSTQTQTSAFALPTGQTSAVSSTEAIRPPAQAVAQDSAPSMGTGLTTANMTYQSGPTAVQSTASTVLTGESSLLNFGFQLPSGRSTFQSEPDAIPQNEGIKIGSRSTLNDAIESRPVLSSTSTQEPKTDSVNKNVQPNELAGGVDLRTMATQPQGYQAYSAAMPDVAFYAPKEIYRNQVNVDNARLLRGLGSDRLHQQMIDMQYK